MHQNLVTVSVSQRMMTTMREKILQTIKIICAAIVICLVSSVALAADNGLLWRVEAPTGKVTYLFGTMHSDDPKVNDFSPAISKALDESEIFMMETLPPRDPSIFLLPDFTLSESLTEKEFDKVRELADVHSMHIEAAMHMKPWLLSVIFDLPKPQSPQTQDVMLMSLARDKGKDIYGLEDTMAHFGVLDSFTLDEQLVMLRSVLKRTQKQKERNFNDLLKVYLKGDLAKVTSMDEKVTGASLPKPLWEKMRTKLLDERNESMANRIIKQAPDTAAFIAVGAAHLSGSQGLLARLRSAGLTVTPVKL